MLRTCLVLILVLCSRVFAQGQDCSKALIQDTYQTTSTNHQLFSLALSVDSRSYEEIKQKAGANAIIYGIPMGGNYDEFRKNVKDTSEHFEEHLDLDQATNVAWTGLSRFGAGAYRDCLVASQTGLSLQLTAATETEVSFVLKWAPVGVENSKVAIVWQWSGPGRDKLPASIPAGSTPIVIPRPNQNLVIAASTIGHSTIPYTITSWPKPASRCDLFALNPRIESCFMIAISRPADTSSVDVRNTCHESWDWSISFGSGPTYGNWAFNDQGRSEPGGNKAYSRQPTNGEQRIYAKPSSCQKLPFPRQGDPEWNRNW